MRKVSQHNTHSHSFRVGQPNKELQKSRNSNNSSISLRFEVSSLLSLFNEMEGEVERERLIRVMQTIGLEQQAKVLTQ